MLRTEYMIVGLLLVMAGSFLAIVGYNKTQPTGLEQAVVFLGQVLGERPPAELRSSKTEGYFFLGGGVAASVLGMIIIHKSRAPHARPQKPQGGNLA